MYGPEIVMEEILGDSSGVSLCYIGNLLQTGGSYGAGLGIIWKNDTASYGDGFKTVGRMIQHRMETDLKTVGRMIQHPMEPGWESFERMIQHRMELSWEISDDHWQSRSLSSDITLIQKIIWSINELIGVRHFVTKAMECNQACTGRAIFEYTWQVTWIIHV